MIYELENKKNIGKAIVRTVAYFDIFDYPLTDFEIWRLLYKNNASLEEVGEVIKEEELKNIIAEEKGFYFLKGREEIIKKRMERYNYSDRKFKRSLKVIKFFKLVPWLKMIAVGNIMGAHNLRNEGDIDFFIITAQGRIWLARFFAIIIVKLMRLRPNLKNSKDKICLSFFISEENLDLKELMLINSEKEDDTYFIYWFAGLVPIYDKNGIYDKFIKSNGWLLKYLPNFINPNILNRRKTTTARSGNYPVNLIFSRLENFFKKWQLKIMPKEIKEIMNKDSRVLISDSIIKSHANDRRDMYRKIWEEKISKINYE